MNPGRLVNVVVLLGKLLFGTAVHFYVMTTPLEILQIGMEIRGILRRLNPVGTLEAFRYEFRLHPNIIAQTYRRIRRHPVLPIGFTVKHLLWTLYFMHHYEKDRHMRWSLGHDRKTLHKFISPCLTAMSYMAEDLVSTNKGAFINKTNT